MLLRLVYLTTTSTFALLRLLPVSGGDKDVEILVVRHQITVLERQLGKTRPRFTPGGRAFLAILIHRLSREVIGRFRQAAGAPGDSAALAGGTPTILNRSCSVVA